MRTAIEVTVPAIGFVLGGSVGIGIGIGIGIGTVVHAVSIGPPAQFFLRVFELPRPRPEDDSVIVARGGRPLADAPDGRAILPE